MTKKKRPTWEDKTPSQPVRLKSGAALNLLDVATSATRIARAFDRAEREADHATRLATGHALIKLATELAAIGHAVVREGRKRS